METNVVVVRLRHFPSAVINRALAHLPHLSQLASISRVYERVYPCMVSERDDDAPIAALADPLRAAGFATYRCGDATDAFDEAHAHLASPASADSGARRLVTLHLQACPSVEFGAKGEDSGAADDERDCAASVLRDDPRDTSSRAARVPALVRAARAYDGRRAPRKSTVLHDTMELQRRCWRALLNFDQQLGSMIALLQRRGVYDCAIIYVHAESAMSLYEHGTLGEAPWDSCLRTFLVRKAPRLDAAHVTKPLSAAHIAPLLLADCGLGDGLGDEKTGNRTCLTFGLSPAWLARAAVNPPMDPFSLQTFFARAVTLRAGRSYACIIWFSINHMLQAQFPDASAELSAGQKLALCAKTALWRNPVDGRSLRELVEHGHIVQIYDHATDKGELCDICTPEWLQTPAATALKADIDAETSARELRTLHMQLPRHTLEKTCAEGKPVAPASAPSEPIVRAAPSEPIVRPATSKPLQAVLRDAIGKEADRLALGPAPTWLTVFVPHDSGGADGWLPDPIIGAFSLPQLRQLAHAGASLYCAKHAHAYVLRATANAVCVGQCTVTPNSLVVPHADGAVVVHRARESDDGGRVPVARARSVVPAPKAGKKNTARSIEANLEQRSRF